MAISFSQVGPLYEAIAKKAEAAAVPVVNAIAEAYEGQLKNVTLVESGGHGMATYAGGYPPSAPEGRPPMFMTGRLRDSVWRTPGSGGGGIAFAAVGPDTIYAATIQWGGVHTGDMWLWIHRTLTPHQVWRKNWVKREVHIGSRPYMTIAVVESWGAMSAAAMETFAREVWG